MYFLMALVGVAFFGTLLALILLALAASLVPPSTRRRLYLLCVAIFPFAWFAWAALIADNVSGFVYEKYLNRSGHDEIWYAPMQNGYTILFLKTFRDGADLSRTIDGGGADLQVFDGGVVSHATEIQISGPYIFGISTAPADDVFFAAQKYSGGTYFLLDTRIHKPETFPTSASLLRRLRPLGIANLALEPATTVYERYRKHWFDYVATVLLWGPFLVVLSLLFRWGWRLRKSTLSAPLTAVI